MDLTTEGYWRSMVDRRQVSTVNDCNITPPGEEAFRTLNVFTFALVTALTRTGLHT
jgi:hypothetical protein